MKKNLFISLGLSAIMAVQPIACYAVGEEQETYSYTFDVCVFDYPNDISLAGGLEARIVEYASTGAPLYKKGEKLRTIAEWTTSATEHEYITCEDVRDDCYYYLEIDELPEDYSYCDSPYVRQGVLGKDLTLNKGIFQIFINNEPYEPRAEGEPYSYTFDAYVVDGYNYDTLMGGLEARLVEYEFDSDSKYCQAGAKLRTIAEWTTSDTEHEYITCEDVRPECVYILEIDELPENYNYAGKSYVCAASSGNFNEDSYNPFAVRLNNEPPYETWDDFPVTKTIKWQLRLFDREQYNVTYKETPIIQGVDVEIAKMKENADGGFTPVEIIGHWNTSETDEIIFTTEDTFYSDIDNFYFGFKYNEYPEKYKQYLDAFAERISPSGYFCDGYYVYTRIAHEIRKGTNYFNFIWETSGKIYDTTMPTTTTTTTTTTEVPTVNESAGDANGDNKISIADAVFIMQSLSNPAEYKLTPENAENADIVNKGDGITSMDALAVQMMDINLLRAEDLPVTSEQLESLMK